MYDCMKNVFFPDEQVTADDLYFGSIRLQRIECGHQLGAVVFADATVNPYVLLFSLQRYEIMWT